MAKAFPSRNALSATLSQTQAQSFPTFHEQTLAKLRREKSSLQRRFPFVKSSHLTEAMARGYGFSSNAALLAAVQENPLALGPNSVSARELHSRLVQLGYPLREDFSNAEPPSPKPPEDYLARLEHLRRLSRRPEGSELLISKLRRECAAQFAEAFSLGHPKISNDKKVLHRLALGAEHSACLPGWANVARDIALKSDRSFPGSDHVTEFFERLPVRAQGKSVEYQSAFVSMPYSTSYGLGGQNSKPAFMAGHLGWAVSTHSEWAWYQPGSTDLQLYRRLTTYEKMLSDWEYSFTRWLLLNRSRLLRSGGLTRQYLLEDIVACPHFPLDLVDYGDCVVRYIDEYAPKLNEYSVNGFGSELKLLMEKWRQEQPPRQS